MRLLRESLPEVVGGLIVAAILATIGILSGVVGLDTPAEMRLANNAIIVGWYSCLWVGAVYVFRAKRQSQIEPSLVLPRFNATVRGATIIALLLATVLLIWSLRPFIIPDLQIRLVNIQDYDVAVYRYVDFSLDLDVPLAEDVWLSTGRAQLHGDVTSLEDNPYLMVPAHGELVVYAKVLNPDQYRRFLEMDNTYITFFLRDANQRIMTFSYGVAFKPAVLANGYIEVQVP